MNRPTHIEDYLAQLHSGQWFGWSDSKNKVYANLIIHDDTKDKPSESDCTTGLANIQADYDANQYQRDRVYPSIGDQLDMLWHSIDQNPSLKSQYFDFYETIKAVKVKHPKNG
ncbi:hypothetical protein N9S53_00415 [Candidatus Pelagibacter sp.]|nr:hypothetical protein [Candidatus Pelagibacter sp.]